MLSPEPLQHRGIPGTKRCYLCNGPFGLIRHRFALKQFCSKQCLDQYKGKIESHGSRSKQWIDFLTRNNESGFPSLPSCLSRRQIQFSPDQNVSKSDVFEHKPRGR